MCTYGLRGVQSDPSVSISEVITTGNKVQRHYLTHDEKNPDGYAVYKRPFGSVHLFQDFYNWIVYGVSSKIE